MEETVGVRECRNSNIKKVGRFVRLVSESSEVVTGKNFGGGVEAARTSTIGLRC